MFNTHQYLSEEQRIEKRVELIKAKHRQLIDQFYVVAERKVSLRDEYGDENWDALDEEVKIVVEKITRKEIGIIQAHADRLADFLDQSFRRHCERKRAQPIAPVDFTRMSGEDFEVYLMDLLSRLGYSVCGTKSTADQGADMLATKGGRTTVIQAKNYRAPVGNAAVQEVAAAVHFYSGHEGWVITNSTFTPAARELAQRAGVRLIDGHELARLSRPVLV